ncbi:TPA: hypothetical protein NV937_000746 [Escherichia coli]|nr:hypothetical protein [Escherichia coli]
MLVISFPSMMIRNTLKNSTKISINHGDLTLSAFIALIVSVSMTKAELIVQTLRLLRDLDIPRMDVKLEDIYIESLSEDYTDTVMMLNDVLYRIDSISRLGSTLKVNMERVDKLYVHIYSLPISILNYR